MSNFKKVLSLKIIILFIAGIFLINNTAYGIDTSGKTYLRPPILMQKGNPDKRLLSSMTKIATIALLAMAPSTALGVNPESAARPEEPAAIFETIIPVSGQVSEAIESGNLDLRNMLNDRGYPEEMYEALLEELERFFNEMASQFSKRSPSFNLPDHTKTYEGQNDSVLLKDFVQIMRASGYVNSRKPNRILILLVNSFTGRDIFRLLETAEVKLYQDSVYQETIKFLRHLKEGLLSCSAISQLSGFWLSSVFEGVRSANNPQHAFSIIPAGDAENKYVIVDVTEGIIGEINLTDYYTKEGTTWVLKPEFRKGLSETLNNTLKNTAREVIDLNKLSEEDKTGLLYHIYPFIHINENDKSGSSSTILLNAGRVFDALGLREEALKAYQAATELDTGYADAFNNFGNTLSALNKLSEAEMKYRKAIELNPRDGHTHYNLGITLALQGRYKEALEEYKEAVRLLPDFAEAYYDLGVVYFNLGNHEEAIICWSRVAELGRKNLLQGLLEKRLPTHIEEIVKQLIKITGTSSVSSSPDDLSFHIQIGLGWFYYKSGREKEAISSFVAAVKIRKTILQDLLGELPKEFLEKLKRELALISDERGAYHYFYVGRDGNIVSNRIPVLRSSI